ncbi:MAG TPA: hopanoid-associated sugar epimerase [Roseiarcus sp.]|nr:hopanoid-associated sugar epimerase [Roseiarcus sp.]
MDREVRPRVAHATLGSASGLGEVAVEPKGERHAPRSTVLVTGASGFLGSAIAVALRARGHDVRALVRPSSPRTNLNRGDTFCEGDLRDRTSLAAALKGARYLFHAAADYRLWARNPEEIHRNNLEGTRLIMEEALSAGVERIVYTSSVATLKNTDGAASTEDNRLADGEGIGAYKRSKVAAERLVEAMIQRDGLPAVIVNPSTPIGPRDVRPTPTGRIIVEAASGRMPAFVDTGLNLAHVDDVAAGHIAALERGRIGERYILGGDNVFLGDMLADIARLVGRRAPTLKLPRKMLYPLAYGAELVARLRGVEPFITSDGLRMARHHMFFDDSKARRELGYVSRPYVEGLADAIAWFRAHRHLK